MKKWWQVNNMSKLVDYLNENHRKDIEILFKSVMFQLIKGSFGMSDIASVYTLGYQQALKDIKEGKKVPEPEIE